jgi:hypothetical protein
LPSGLLYKWFASSEDIEQGSKVLLKGTVKKIAPDKYSGGQIVVELTRCKVEQVFISKEEHSKYLSDEQVAQYTAIVQKFIPNFNEQELGYGTLENFLAAMGVISWSEGDKPLKKFKSNNDFLTSVANVLAIMNANTESYSFIEDCFKDPSIFQLFKSVYNKRDVIEKSPLMDEFIQKMDHLIPAYHNEFKPAFDALKIDYEAKRKYQGRNVAAESFSAYYQKRSTNGVRCLECE